MPFQGRSWGLKVTLRLADEAMEMASMAECGMARYVGMVGDRDDEMDKERDDERDEERDDERDNSSRRRR